MKAIIPVEQARGLTLYYQSQNIMQIILESILNEIERGSYCYRHYFVEEDRIVLHESEFIKFINDLKKVGYDVDIDQLAQWIFISWEAK